MFIVSICAGIKDSSAEDITNIMWWPKAKHVISVKRDEHSQVKKRSKVGFWTKNLNRMYIASFNVLLRSPGGTPLKTRSQNTSVPADSDPAAIIAHALQRKFSHSVFKDSPGQQPLNASSTHCEWNLLTPGTICIEHPFHILHSLLSINKIVWGVMIDTLISDNMWLRMPCSLTF